MIIFLQIDTFDWYSRLINSALRENATKRQKWKNIWHCLQNILFLNAINIARQSKSAGNANSPPVLNVNWWMLCKKGINIKYFFLQNECALHVHFLQYRLLHKMCEKSLPLSDFFFFVPKNTGICESECSMDSIQTRVCCTSICISAQSALSHFFLFSKQILEEGEKRGRGT